MAGTAFLQALGRLLDSNQGVITVRGQKAPVVFSQGMNGPSLLLDNLSTML